VNNKNISQSKLLRLKTILKSYKSVVIAFSGGTDSTFLLHCASQIPELRFIAVTVKTPYIPDWEIIEAIDFCKNNNINHKLVELPFPELIRNNPVERCYLCKKSLFTHIISFAGENGYNSVADGTNADDTGDFRPGLKALSELSIKSPLLETGLTKREIRKLSEKDGLPTWNKPPYACLLTRIPYNSVINEDILKKIEEAEVFIREAGYPGTRVRINGEEARLECQPIFLEKIIEKHHRDIIVKKLKEIGFRFISLDLEGYRTGSFNPLKKKL
jgi:pyridinium-3,5-biscarboxylic acid mononucleotide sulfurtransferase